MERPSNSDGSNGGVDDDEEKQPLGGSLETERAPQPHAHAAEQEAGRGRFRRASVRAALVLCLLTLPAVLLLQRWQAASSPEWLFEAEPPAEDDDQGTTRPHVLPLCTYVLLLIPSDLSS